MWSIIIMIKLISSQTFFLGDQVVNATNAIKKCQEQGLVLASINNQQEAIQAQQICQQASTHNACWIGLIRYKYETEFEWIDGSSVNYINWYKNQPNSPFNQTAYVVLFASSFYWADFDFSTTNWGANFLCRQPSTTMEPTTMEPTTMEPTTPTAEPIPQPKTRHFGVPTPEPTSRPSGEPTPEPTSRPGEDSEEPTPEPTSRPSQEPTRNPTKKINDSDDSDDSDDSNDSVR